jgi:hypothetical protein
MNICSKSAMGHALKCAKVDKGVLPMVYQLQACKRLQDNVLTVMISTQGASEGYLSKRLHQEPGRKFVELL